jgi:ankyrin repeat protein
MFVRFRAYAGHVEMLRKACFGNRIPLAKQFKSFSSRSAQLSSPAVAVALLLGTGIYQTSAEYMPSDQVNEIMVAISAGNNEQVAELLSQGVGPESKNEDGWSPLLVAALTGNVTAAAQLLREGADVEQRLDGEDTPLMLAAMYGHKNMVVFLAAEGGANVNAQRPSNKETPLIIASAVGDDDIVEALILLGADIEAADGSGDTALSHAARYRHKLVVSVLLQRGAEMEAGNDLSGMRWANVNQGKQRKPPPK